MDVKTLCLGVLSRAPATGYDLRKSFQTGPFSHFCGAGFGSIYPALHALSEQGYIQECKPEPRSRERKKVFAITRKGEQALRKTLADSSPLEEDVMRSEFMFRLFFAHMTPRSQVESLLRTRRAFYQQKLDHIDIVLKQKSLRPGERFIAEMGQTIIRTAMQFLDKNGDVLLNAPSQEVE